ncbi:hypothetical protein EVAR_39039_1 [Eumeta japonica]|uniref:Uncharacterized protein n=1 Tax=Eumeta variegata TaxID=151549 RepID=A0A4C1WRW9_EUMVA|nr:hypothetical protein EVAR_39039_1 [Eumeta japonica]
MKNSISELARARNDDWGQAIVERLEQVTDLVAADAQYHNSGMKKLYQTPSTEERKKKSLNSEDYSGAVELQEFNVLLYSSLNIIHAWVYLPLLVINKQRHSIKYVTQYRPPIERGEGGGGRVFIIRRRKCWAAFIGGPVLRCFSCYCDLCLADVKPNRGPALGRFQGEFHSCRGHLSPP